MQATIRIPDEIRSRHAAVIDGEAMDDKRVKFLSILAKEYISQIMGLNNWIDAYKGQIDGLRHELAVAQHQQDQFGNLPGPAANRNPRSAMTSVLSPTCG